MPAVTSLYELSHQLPTFDPSLQFTHVIGPGGGRNLPEGGQHFAVAVLIGQVQTMGVTSLGIAALQRQ
ncbi:hypothetical protein D3C81_2099990 [compost metagenome]